MLEKTIAVIKKEPIEPETVLFGLIEVNFGPLNIFPKINPPISEAIQLKINVNKIILSCKKLEKITKSIQNVKT